MTLQEIPRQRWRAYLDQFSRTHHDAPAHVEMYKGAANHACDVADLPLNFYLRRPVLEVHTREGLSRAFDGHAAVAVVGERVVQSADNPAGVTVLWRATLGARGVAVLAPER